MFRDFFKKSLLLQRVSKADHVITHSESMLRELKNNLNTDRISKIPFYVYFSKDEVISRISDNELSIFFAARLEKEKGAHILLKSLPLVAHKVNKKLRVVIAGEEVKNPILESISKDICAKESDIKIHFPGWLNHRDKLYEFSPKQRVCYALFVARTTWNGSTRGVMPRRPCGWISRWLFRIPR